VITLFFFNVWVNLFSTLSMDKLEIKLNNLPKARLGWRADLKIKTRLYTVILRKRLASEKMRFSSGSRALAGSLLLLILIIVPGYAYASAAVVPGDFLYPLKIGLEKIELNLARETEKKAEVYAELSARRLAEAKTMIEAGDGTEADKADKEEKIKNNLDQALSFRARALSGFSDSGSGATTSKAKAMDERGEAMLINIAQSAGTRAGDDLVDSIALALDRVKNGKSLKNYKEDREETEKRPDDREEGRSAFIRVASSTEEEKSEEGRDNERGFNNANGRWALDKNGRFSGTSTSPLTGTTTADRDDISNLRKGVDRLKKDLRRPEFEQKDVDDLMDRLERKIKKAEEIGETDEDGAQSLFRSAEALSDNARHFIRKRSVDSENSLKKSQRKK